MKKTIKDLNLKNKKVILRVDFNVPIADGKIMDTKRIDAALPTIQYILDKGASIIILSHLGRIKEEADKASKSLKIVAEKLQSLLPKIGVTFLAQTRGEEVEKAAKALKPGQILFLENTRFEDLNDKAESKNSEVLAKFWASLADVYVNDAFATAHRAHASTVGIANFIKESALGFLMQTEVENLSKLLKGFKRPFVSIIGGAKVSDKIKVLEKLFGIADKVLIGGGMAYTFKKAMGKEIGTSLFEPDRVEDVKKYLVEHKDKIVLPIDNAISTEFANLPAKFTTPDNDNIPEGYMGLDIGPETIKLFASEISNAKTIFWNGPLGVTEFSEYEKGTKSVAITIANKKDVFSVVGGGDSVTAINKLGYQDKFSFISTGGGASIEFIQNGTLPGIDAIQDK
ncbi:phosphoglycerate kinase [Metamycoplasma hyosynoviae]|uniref:Phosphoglycerate kinase n=1 Tax=Metamycoplasma hyosynoviae TaxID=29559 RepID=A0AAP4EL63_9BACT|nr:phosphoglycerate kinase [Metamycoplasma hyosynoviae]MDC8901121.1 phosphoglycerate kinase [Metamycoplasma hyosynoviae]MDC8912481.1 phosphoglycerate kinase [Metamycoplasma hyosynoviae]MDC8913214.1 phosphoglycerate kinase [Metamycoplasma hyosynoviae]MDC8915397.1 phosphoglycerate kinase [Metamycoplasma hyosynoviae]MDC8916611.1 phosphoglycerate kinase [Metamycoplasma hyosynoviae]